MNERSSHERTCEPGSEAESGSSRKEAPSTLAGFDHQLSYGETADPHDQADGFFKE